MLKAGSKHTSYLRSKSQNKDLELLETSKDEEVVSPTRRWKPEEESSGSKPSPQEDSDTEPEVMPRTPERTNTVSKKRPKTATVKKPKRIPG